MSIAVLKAGLVCFVITIAPSLAAQQAASLPRSNPEAQGISSKAIITFLDSIAASKHEFHSIMILRHGNVVAERWWNPYRADLKHTLYSLSKSFTATAVGFARAEGKLGLTDNVISFFPNQLPDTVSAFLNQLTIKDLLTMSVGQEPDPTPVVVSDSNWVRRFLALKIAHKPGTTFLYNSMATYMLSAIVQKTTGQRVTDYLKPRLFDPLGISGVDWETDEQGINTGGWGLRVKTEDIARFAQLFLQKGKWQGKQVLPAGWAEEASTAKIIQHPTYSKAKRDLSDWEQGYCYQMWRCRHNAFRGDGAFGQYAVVMPEQDAVIAITSETADLQGELNLIWNILLPAMKKGTLPSNQESDALLQQRLAALAVPGKAATVADSISQSVNEKTFVLTANPQKIQSLQVRFANAQCLLSIQTDSAKHDLAFGADWQAGTTTMHGPYLVAGARNSLNGLPPFQVAGRYRWIDANTLELVLRYIESPHTQTIVFHFNGNKVTTEWHRSFFTDGPGAVQTLEGEAK